MSRRDSDPLKLIPRLETSLAPRSRDIGESSTFNVDLQERIAAVAPYRGTFSLSEAVETEPCQNRFYSIGSIDVMTRSDLSSKDTEASSVDKHCKVIGLLFLRSSVILLIKVCKLSCPQIVFSMLRVLAADAILSVWVSGTWMAVAAHREARQTPSSCVRSAQPLETNPRFHVRCVHHGADWKRDDDPLLPKVGMQAPIEQA